MERLVLFIEQKLIFFLMSIFKYIRIAYKNGKKTNLQTTYYNRFIDFSSKSIKSREKID